MTERAEPVTAPSMLIADCLLHAARARPDSIGLVAPGRPPLTYAALLRQVEATTALLRAAGINRRDRVAVVLPNGPEMAAATVAVICGAACAPLNPAYGAEEFRFYLSDLGAKALLLSADDPGPARAVAGELGIPCFDLAWRREDPAGIYTVAGRRDGSGSGPVPGPQPDDVGLVLHTSGTTSRPKLVPLSHANLAALAKSVVPTLRLGIDDRCLNVLPLFHIHGIAGALLSTLVSGGSIACTPGYRDGQFVAWLDELRPTWTTAVPSVYQAILAELARGGAGAAAGRLRFARSASAAMPPTVMRELEAALQAPVIEAYGMTEAVHQVASNPLPPGVRKPGSVGVPTGLEVAIMDAGSRLLPAGERGEIVLRGDNVMRGYEANPEANAQAFSAGWFRTGDEGYFDADGYLFITGRLKEIVNRGGEKVSPREVDEALLEHPAVAQAVAFGVAHPTLGEDLAAAVVLKPGATARAEDIRSFLFGRLAGFKIPSEVVVVHAIPKGPTGKVQRIGLAARLADALVPVSVVPRGETEEALAAIFAEVLGIDRVGAADNFFACGGDSLRAFQVIGRIRRRWQVEIPILQVFKAPTVAQLARCVDEARRGSQAAAIAAALAEVEAISDDEARRRSLDP